MAKLSYQQAMDMVKQGLMTQGGVDKLVESGAILKPKAEKKEFIFKDANDKDVTIKYTFSMVSDKKSRPAYTAEMRKVIETINDTIEKFIKEKELPEPIKKEEPVTKPGAYPNV